MKIYPFVMTLVMCFFSLVLICFKVFFDIDVTWGQSFMPMWIGIPVINLFWFLVFWLESS